MSLFHLVAELDANPELMGAMNDLQERESLYAKHKLTKQEIDLLWGKGGASDAAALLAAQAADAVGTLKSVRMTAMTWPTGDGEARITDVRVLCDRLQSACEQKFSATGNAVLIEYDIEWEGREYTDRWDRVVCDYDGNKGKRNSDLHVVSVTETANKKGTAVVRQKGTVAKGEDWEAVLRPASDLEAYASWNSIKDVRPSVY